MTSYPIRLVSALVAIAIACAATPAARAGADFDKLVIVSTTDTKGKTRPCGCKIPKGGFPRRAAFIDQLKAEYPQVAVVDNGAFFPEADSLEDQGWFVMDALQALRVDAVGLSERELRKGLGVLKAHVARTRIPIVSANLRDKASGAAVFPPYVIKRIGTVKVGFVGVMGDQFDLGPSRDSLQVEEPAAALHRVVPEMRKKGATAVVLLSQVGKVESEDLVASVPGIDAVIVGHVVPMYDTGRMIRTTIATYSGEDGEHAGKTVLTLGPAREVVSAESFAVALDPQIPENAPMNDLVTRFENDLRERRLKAAQPAARTARKP